jgi:lactate dehydrogenase-like 2-hydroxyacid dehydrogenase
MASSILVSAPLPGPALSSPRAQHHVTVGPPETKNLLSREKIAKMRPGAVVVNTARGACADELALAEGLAEGRLAGVGLDAMCTRPSPRSPRLCSRGSARCSCPTRECRCLDAGAMASLAVSSVLDVLGGREPSHRVP